MKQWVGKSIFIIGLIHTIFGFVFMHRTLLHIVQSGVFNTIHGQVEREAVFWFLFSGFSLIILGALINWIEKRGEILPDFLRWSFLAITITGIVIMPLSGFWLLLIPVTGFFMQSSGHRNQA